MSGATGSSVSLSLPEPGTPWLDASGRVAPVWYHVILRLIVRTGGTPGTNVKDLQAEIVVLQALVQALEAEVSNLEVLSVDNMVPLPGAPLPSVFTAALMTTPQDVPVSAGQAALLSRIMQVP
jgi:hypothetical protein